MGLDWEALGGAAFTERALGAVGERSAHSVSAALPGQSPPPRTVTRIIRRAPPKLILAERGI